MLDAARALQSKLSSGESGAKKRRKYSVEKYLSHPQFCRLGSATTTNKEAYDEGFERIFGKTPTPVEYGQREGYMVKRYTGRVEPVLIDDEDFTATEMVKLKKKRRERLRAKS